MLLDKPYIQVKLDRSQYSEFAANQKHAVIQKGDYLYLSGSETFNSEISEQNADEE